MNKIISLITVFALLIQVSGCSVRKVQRVNTSDLPNPAVEKIVGITTKAGAEVGFDPPGAVVQNSKLEAKVNKKPYEISIDQVERFWVERREHSTARTIGLVAALVVGAIGVAAIIVAATKESCPFIYSWDGQQFVFDGEPYGAAITKGLERDDYSELRRLMPDKGLYRLMISNGVDETQYTNLRSFLFWITVLTVSPLTVPAISTPYPRFKLPLLLLTIPDKHCCPGSGQQIDESGNQSRRQIQTPAQDRISASLFLNLNQRQRSSCS